MIADLRAYRSLAMCTTSSPARRRKSIEKGCGETSGHRAAVKVVISNFEKLPMQPRTTSSLDIHFPHRALFFSASSFMLCCIQARLVAACFSIFSLSARSSFILYGSGT